MKKILICSVFLFVTLISAFKQDAEERYVVDVERSSVKWLAKKILGQHSGSVKLSSGSLMLNGSNLVSGTFAMNMTSIDCDDLDDGSNQMLTDHLKSIDFFSVAKNPISTFRITKVMPLSTDQATIMGNLTIKGITAPVTFTASIRKQNNMIVAAAKNIKVDRTKYNIRYRSANFFGDLGDKAIENEFELSVTLVARLSVS
jgi:polyisoprenoid-binding protein YceI